MERVGAIMMFNKKLKEEITSLRTEMLKLTVDNSKKINELQADLFKVQHPKGKLNVEIEFQSVNFPTLKDIHNMYNYQYNVNLIYKYVINSKLESVNLMQLIEKELDSGSKLHILKYTLLSNQVGVYIGAYLSIFGEKVYKYWIVNQINNTFNELDGTDVFKNAEWLI